VVLFDNHRAYPQYLVTFRWKPTPHWFSQSRPVLLTFDDIPTAEPWASVSDRP